MSPHVSHECCLYEVKLCLIRGEKENTHTCTKAQYMYICVFFVFIVSFPICFLQCLSSPLLIGHQEELWNSGEFYSCTGTKSEREHIIYNVYS